MTNKYLMGGIFCFALAGCAAQSPQGQPADKAANTNTARTVDYGMVLIPAGEFTMGSDKETNEAMWRGANALNPYGFKDKLYVDEHPAHKVVLPAYYVDKYEVTNEQYRDFVIASQHSVPYNWNNGYNLSKEMMATLPLEHLRKIATNQFRLDMDVTNMTKEDLLAELDKVQDSRNTLPVTTVTWPDADAYCHWAGKRLPTEAEWEKAARGPQGYEYPWGNSWDPKMINTMSENPDQPYAPVGSYPGDKSGYGVYDMAANVTEWVADWYDAYPGAPVSEENKYYGKKQRVVRGGMTSSGHYDALSMVFRNAKRTHLRPYSALIDVGFRCAKDAN
ncbi:MAG TPA: SUMF1/EgtB/PvdO family nonheme iron enzyme [Gallionella sp.]|nr:SUMF1/EgtB/PvdO family nonheme iron enzyme [Gallionella sp.]